MDGYDSAAHADVYLATGAGTMGQPRVLWRMTVADAQQVCSDPSTQGMGRGGPWMLCWTTHSLVDRHWDSFAADDGRFAPLFERLGVTVLMSRQTLLDGTAIWPEPEPAPAPVTVGGMTQLGLFAGVEVEAA